MQYHQESIKLNKLHQIDHLIWLFIIVSQHPINGQTYHNYWMLMYFHQESNKLNKLLMNGHLILLFIILSQYSIIEIRIPAVGAKNPYLIRDAGTQSSKSISQS
ncbi:unnamed protein product [Paramecium octaurelia]|uniref:Uncharacterized protein n=1 Tax=Paramecium octaurelia TaxID=43137 RepID=A0A8S1V2E8_PAROT|nr:unnamed protein product [Paramecium octaurelia]